MKELIGRSGTLVGMAAAAVVIVLLASKVERMEENAQELWREAYLPGVGGFAAEFVTAHAPDENGSETIVVGRPPEGALQLVYTFRASCPYCLASAPHIRAIEAALKERPEPRLTFIGLTTDSVAEARRYADEQGFGFPIANLPRGRLPYLFKAGAVPQLTVIDHQGRLRYARVGQVTAETPDSLFAALDSLMALVEEARTATAAVP